MKTAADEYIVLDNPGFGAAHNVAIRKAMKRGAGSYAVSEKNGA